MRPIGIIVLCVILVLTLLTGTVFLFRSKKGGNKTDDEKPTVLSRLSLWSAVPLSKKVPLMRPRGPYFPVQGKDKIVAFDDVLSDAECTYLIQAADKAFVEKSLTVAHLKKESTSWLNFIERRLASILQTHPGKMETMQIQRYRRSSTYEPHPHLDVIQEGDPAGQRMSTIIVFLNDLPELEEGGRTIFGRLNAGIRPNKGTAIAWNNVDPKSKKVDEEVIHSGEPLYLKKSTKYILIGWSRERAFETE